MLQQKAEANGIEGEDEPLETTHTPNGKIEFHDDSDEVGTHTHKHTHTHPYRHMLKNLMGVSVDAVICLKTAGQ